MKNKRILISEDQTEINRTIHAINQTIMPKLNSVKRAYSRLRGMPEFDDEVLELIKGLDVDSIRDHVFDKMKGQTNGTMLDHVLAKEICERTRPLLDEVQELYNIEGCFDLLEYVSYSDNMFIILDEAQDAIKEAHRTYISSKKAIELYDVHKKAAEALNQYYQMARVNVNGGNLEGLMRHFDFSVDDQIITEKVNYEEFHYTKEK